MDEVFEQTLSVAPLTEDALFADVGSSLLRFKVIREANWRGPDARGGPLHSDIMPQATEEPAKKSVPASAPSAPAAASAGFFAAASEAVGGGRRGADFARALQRWLVGYVDSLPLDEIELMAKA